MVTQQFADSTAIENFSRIFHEALKTSPSEGNGFGLALASFLGIAALFGAVCWFLFRSLTKSRDRQEKFLLDQVAELRAQSATDKAQAIAARAKWEQDSKQSTTEAELRFTQQREREADAARDRARADQADRESAREKLTQHVDTVIDKLQDGLQVVLGRIDTAIGVLQGKFEAHDGRIISLEKDLARHEAQMKELKAEIRELKKHQ